MNYIQQQLRLEMTVMAAIRLKMFSLPCLFLKCQLSYLPHLYRDMRNTTPSTTPLPPPPFAPKCVLAHVLL